MKRIQTNDNATNTFQDLNYWYDAVGNIVMIKDDAQQTLYYNGSVVDPILKYTYDPIYRLIESEGRELIGNVLVSPPTAITDSQFNGNYNDAPWMGDFLTGAGGNVQNYTQEYSYDEVNNMTQLKHSASSQSYTRNLVYNTNSNQLQSTTVGSSTMNYTYDAMGNMVNLPHLNGMLWNNSNQLACVQKSTVNIFYQYDGAGNRTRKYATDVNGNVEERIYLGEIEIFRTFVSSSLTLERTTMHVSNGSGRIAMLEVRTVGSDAAPAVLRRYIYSNHLQTASLELDENKNIISYEEYHAFGTTAYQLTNASINAIAKRYKYSGKEKDEESGLYYHGARYYIPWLCRWSQCDPIGIKDGLNIYVYCSNNPVGMHDPSGMNGECENRPKLTRDTTYAPAPNDSTGTSCESSEVGTPAPTDSSAITSNNNSLDNSMSKNSEIKHVSLKEVSIIQPKFVKSSDIKPTPVLSQANEKKGLWQKIKDWVKGVFSSKKDDKHNEIKTIDKAKGNSQNENIAQIEFSKQIKVKSVENANNVSTAGLDMIAYYEEFKPVVYKVDGKGNPTIGYGHEILPGENFSNGINKEQAYSILKKDANIAVNAIRRNVTISLNQNQFDALTSYVFNTGSLRGTKLLKNLNAGNFKEAANQMDINTSNGEFMQGLENRRIKERKLFLYGIY